MLNTFEFRYRYGIIDNTTKQMRVIMNFKNYWHSLDKNEREELAQNAGFTVGYINTHLISRRKSPPVRRIANLAKATNGKFSFEDLCRFFAGVE